MPKFSSRTRPLTDILAVKGKGMQPLNWTMEAKEAFEDIGTTLCTSAILYASFPNRSFRVYTDTLNVGLGAVLTQETPVGEQPIFFLSPKFTKPKRN